MRRGYAFAGLGIVIVVGAAVLFARMPSEELRPEAGFIDKAAESGIAFIHDMGIGGEKMMVETMGSGGGFLDYDNDGDLDLYLINGAPMPGYKGSGPLRNALYRNEGKGLFKDVTSSSETGDTGYGMGLCTGDYDNDGFTDIYLTNFGRNVLYRNRGGGSFDQVTTAAGVEDAHWGASCAFLDHDRDGDLDLYVSNYAGFSIDNNQFCGDYSKGVRSYCGPTVYPPEPDILYLNNGDGTFADVSEAAGLTERWGYGLGVATGDYDNDGNTDLYIANDQTPNILYRNDGGQFVDETLLAGVGYSIDGVPQAGMGTEFADYDNDGDIDLIVTNLDFEYNALYRNEGDGIFSDSSFDTGLANASLAFVGFGVSFLDYDNDGILDLAVANGHILDNASYFNDAATYAQRPHLFRGLPGGTMAELGEEAGSGLMSEVVGRGLAPGDFDNDGNVDLLLTVCGGAPRLLHNTSSRDNGWIGVHLVGTRSNRSALGARVVASGPHGSQLREVRSGGSYLSQPDQRLHFGLGTMTEPLSLSVRWPSGLSETFQIADAGGYVTLVEGEGE